MSEKVKGPAFDHRDAEATYAKATKAELARDYDQAFRFQLEKDKAKWKLNAGKALERAEKIKRFIEKPKTGSSPSSPQASSEVRLTPIAINHFSPQEQLYVLKKGTCVNNLLFPFWDEPTVNQTVSTPFQDPDGQPQLSPEQLKVSPVWRRPSCQLREPQTESISDSGTSGIHPLKYERRILPQEILQHVVTDCSVCASVSVCLEHDRRFGSNLARSSLYHYDSGKSSTANAEASSTPRSPEATDSGRYDIKVLFNGACRRIVIDDKLPYNPANHTLMCMSVLEPTGGNETCSKHDALWPSLLEKGYMKLMGGYDFPGSNSSIDLHALAGWIPDHIEIKSSSFEREKTWERLLSGFSSGQCVVTVGTGTSSGVYWRNVEFLPSHSYAVVDVIETEEERSFTVLDSWVRPTDSGQQPSRILHIPWSDVLDIFDGIYLSWDPQSRPSILTFHGMWKRSEEDGPSHHVRLQFDSGDHDEAEIWILLTRHIVETQRTSDFISLRVEIEDDLMPEARDVDLHTISATGTYTNSTHVIVRSRIPPPLASGTLSIFASYEGESSNIGFTLTAYAPPGMKIAWDERLRTPPFTAKVEGTLTNKNAGGNCTYPTFMINPQYYLRIHPQKSAAGARNGTKAKVTLVMQAKKDVPVNVAVAWSQGERLNELTEKELAASSGAYAYGLARVTKDLSVGEYTIVTSAFEPHHMGPYSLKVESTHPFDLKPIPQEGAGMYDKSVRGAWDSNTAAGGPSFQRYSKNPIYELDIPSLAQIKIRLQLLHPSTATALNITVYPASSSLSTLPRHVATSGGYDDAIAGVATPQLAVSAGKYWMVPSTYHPGVETRFRLIIYSSVGNIKIQRLVT